MDKKITIKELKEKLSAVSFGTEINMKIGELDEEFTYEGVTMHFVSKDGQMVSDVGYTSKRYEDNKIEHDDEEY